MVFDSTLDNVSQSGLDSERHKLWSNNTKLKAQNQVITEKYFDAAPSKENNIIFIFIQPISCSFILPWRKSWR